MAPKKGKVLIVEDQKLWREQFFGEPLRDLGLTLFPAATKAKALALLDKHRFDLAIIDVNLTDVTGNTDGLLVVDRLLDSGAKTPIIVVSGSADAIRTLGQQAYNKVFAKIQKASFELEEFINQVQKALKQSR